MSEPTSEMIEAGEQEFSRVLIEGRTEQAAMVAAYLAMRAADPDVKALVDAGKAMLEAHDTHCFVHDERDRLERALRNISGGDDD